MRAVVGPVERWRHRPFGGFADRAFSRIVVATLQSRAVAVVLRRAAIEAESFVGGSSFCADVARYVNRQGHCVGIDRHPVGDGGRNYNFGFVDDDVDDVVLASLGRVVSVVWRRIDGCAYLFCRDIIDVAVGIDFQDDGIFLKRTTGHDQRLLRGLITVCGGSGVHSDGGHAAQVRYCAGGDVHCTRRVGPFGVRLSRLVAGQRDGGRCKCSVETFARLQVDSNLAQRMLELQQLAFSTARVEFVGAAVVLVRILVIDRLHIIGNQQVFVGGCIVGCRLVGSQRPRET